MGRGEIARAGDSIAVAVQRTLSSHVPASSVDDGDLHRTFARYAGPVKSTYEIREARTRFNELVRAAKCGREVVITERGRPVARLVGLAEPTRLADRLVALQAQGVLTAFPGAVDDDIRPVARKRGALARFLAAR